MGLAGKQELRGIISLFLSRCVSESVLEAMEKKGDVKVFFDIMIGGRPGESRPSLALPSGRCHQGVRRIPSLCLLWCCRHRAAGRLEFLLYNHIVPRVRTCAHRGA